VVIFALGGLPEIEWLALDAPLGVAESLRERMRLTVDALEAASLVNGLILFQIVLITLMGSNNGAREIAGQRAYYEKERLNGLRPASFWAAESLFVAGLGALQGLWMALFVKFVCGFPGPLLPQGACLAAIGAAMSLICLGFSAHARSPERASLVSIYWVGFQLPLSGIVLALPVALEWICRPVISAYWAWGGYLHSMRASRYFDAFRLTSREWLPDSAVALLVLGVHALVGAFLAWMGCRRRFWDG
jgi:hypothetical protein